MSDRLPWWPLVCVIGAAPTGFIGAAVGCARNSRLRLWAGRPLAAVGVLLVAAGCGVIVATALGRPSVLTACVGAIVAGAGCGAFVMGAIRVAGRRVRRTGSELPRPLFPAVVRVELPAAPRVYVDVVGLLALGVLFSVVAEAVTLLVAERLASPAALTMVGVSGILCTAAHESAHLLAGVRWHWRGEFMWLGAVDLVRWSQEGIPTPTREVVGMVMAGPLAAVVVGMAVAPLTLVVGGFIAAVVVGPGICGAVQLTIGGDGLMAWRGLRSLAQGVDTVVIEQNGMLRAAPAGTT